MDIKIDRNKKIKDVEPIEVSGGGWDISGEKIFEFIEEPLLNPVKNLYDKNIETNMSSANRKNIGDYAYIQIFSKYLSEDNLRTLQLLAGNFPEKIEFCDDKWIGSYFNLKMSPITAETTVGEINDYFEDMTKGLKLQDVKRDYFDTLDDVKDFCKSYVRSENITEEELKLYMEELDIVEYEGHYYRSEETLRRHLVYLRSKQEPDKSTNQSLDD